MVRVFAKMGESPNVAIHGQVATKPHIVDLILDLVGFKMGCPLPQRTLLDPGCGEGAFLFEAARRLIAAAKRLRITACGLGHCLLGIDKDSKAVTVCRERLRALLASEGIHNATSRKLINAWTLIGDFLADDLGRSFDYIVGNPPYVRQEGIPKADLLRYRTEFQCFYDRADLYILFFERGLRCLSDDGMLGYICPNRFCRNRYGKKLRDLITREYCVKHIIDLSNASPFEQEVISYPAIFIVGRGTTGEVDHACMANATPAECDEARLLIQDKNRKSRSAAVERHVYTQWFAGDQRWTTESPDHLALLHRIEDGRSLLGSDSSGTIIGIGVATGADRVFIVKPEVIEIETELLLPLAMTRDIASGRVDWQGFHVINPFSDDGSGGLIDLNKYPKAKAYFSEHREQIQGRNVAKRNRVNWFRTIDRIYPRLRRKKKLLIPDIKATNLVVYEGGELYPHHNLYFVTSDYWDLQALQAILRSSLAKFCVWMNGVKMRAGWFRFQAQYLRRIPLPHLMEIKGKNIARLRAVAEDASIDAIDAVVADVYGLSAHDLDLIRSAGTVAPTGD